MVMASGQRISAISRLVAFAHEGRRVRQGVHPLSLPVISTWADSVSQIKALEASTPLDSDQELALSRTETKLNSFLCSPLFNCTQLLILSWSLSHLDLIYIRTRV